MVMSISHDYFMKQKMFCNNNTIATSTTMNNNNNYYYRKINVVAWEEFIGLTFKKTPPCS